MANVTRTTTYTVELRDQEFDMVVHALRVAADLASSGRGPYNPNELQQIYQDLT